MSETFHTISSSEDENSNDSLPDLQTRLLSKLPNLQQLVHTISSDDDDGKEKNDKNRRSPKKSLIDEILRYKNKENKENKKDEENEESEPEIIEDVIKPEISTISKSKIQSFMTDDYFNEELPDIKDFTLLTGGSDYKHDENEAHKDEEPLHKIGSRKLGADVVREEKEAKREALKQQKALEKAQTKAQKDAQRTCQRAMKPGECMRYVKVQIDRHLLELPEGSQVLSHLQSVELRYEVVDSPVPYVVSVKRIDPLSLQESLAEDAVVIVPIKEFLELVERQVYYNGVSGLCEQCERWKMLLAVPRLTLIVAGLPEFFRGKRTNKHQEYRVAVLGEKAQPKKRKKKGSNEITSKVSRIDVETALTMLQLECGVNHRLISDPDKIGTFITQVTKSLAEAPYKREKEDSSFSWFAEGSSVNSVKTDKSGIGLLKLWRQQLQQFNNVGAEVAQAIVREYPSPQALIQAYKHSTTEKEASLLLASIPVRRGAGPLVSTRRIGPELSKKIHMFFTCMDPEVNLGHKS